MPVKIPSDDVYRARLLERSASAANGCRLWTGAKKPAGYGNVSYQGTVIGAHTAAYRLWRGPVPLGMCVCHRCDEPRCIEPGHLFLGTHIDNALDMVEKGRGTKFRKLTDAQVRDMVAARLGGEPLKTVAERFAISEATVSNFARGKDIPSCYRRALTDLNVVFPEEQR